MVVGDGRVWGSRQLRSWGPRRLSHQPNVLLIRCPEAGHNNAPTFVSQRDKQETQCFLDAWVPEGI